MFKMADFFLKNQKFTIVITFAFVLFGYMALVNLSSETFPSVNIGSVIVTTVYPGASAEDIESKITRPIEDQIRSVRGLKEVKSVSQPGISRVIVVADTDNYDVEEVVSDLQRAIDRTTELPADLENPPHFFEIKSEEFPVVELAVIGENKNRKRDLIADDLKEELEDIKSIATITLTGFKNRQFNILIHQNKLKNFHVGLNEVISRLRTQNINIPGGSLEANEEGQKIVRIEGKIKSVEALKNLVVRSNFSGEKVLLKDIADVEDGEEDPETQALFEGQPATLITISKKGGADIIRLSQQIKDILAKYRTKHKDFEFTVFNDEGVRVNHRVGILSSNGLVGLVLVMIFLFIFLPGPVGFMTALSLPLAIFATIGFIQAAGYTLNTITILALVIALGMLVDNAVVISENFVRLKQEGREAQEALLLSIRDLWVPITATALTTIAAFAPMLVTKGIIGDFISGIPVVVSIALGFSLMEGFLLLPARLMLVGQSVKANKNVQIQKLDWFDKYVLPRFRPVLEWLVEYKYLSAGIFSGMIFGAIFMIAVVNKFILFPADQTEIYLSRLELEEKSLIIDTEKKLQELTQEIRNVLGKKALFVVARAGISEQDFTDPKSRRGDNVGVVHIFMTEESKNNESTNDILTQMRKIKIAGARSLTFEAMINGPPVGDPVTVTFRSNDETQLVKISEELITFLKSKQGIFDAKIDDVYGPDELFVNIDPVKASRLGLNHAEAGSMVRAAIAGEIINDVTLDNKDVNYFLRFNIKDRQTADNIKNILISDRAGNLIPISQFADITQAKGAPQIKRFDFKRAKTITASLDDNIITSVEINAQIVTFFEEISKNYPDVTLEFGGEAERTEESMASLFQALVLSIVGIFALLVLVFNSYIRPLIILTTIPLGLVGVSLAFFLHGRPISFLALTGVIGLGGIIVNSGIILISFIDQMREENPDKNFGQILVEASLLRMRAVIITSLTTVCGLLPTAYGIGGADEFIIPMTMALAWGLVSGTVLTVLWVPSAYAITEDVATKLKFLMRRWQ